MEAFAPNLNCGLAVTMLIAPAETFFPNRVDWGPRSTSMRSTSGRSSSADEVRERKTPSTNTPTELSIPSLPLPLPKPRMTKLV